jgi:hypothetical protein
MRLLFDYFPTIAGLIIGLLLVLWPPPQRTAEEQSRQQRLAELRAGAEERFFEERRELEAYGPSSAGIFRFWGFLVLTLSLLALFL